MDKDSLYHRYCQQDATMKDMPTLTEAENKEVNKALNQFENALDSIEKNSTDAFALSLFIIACYDRSRFNYSQAYALNHYPKANRLIKILKELIGRDNNMDKFNCAIECAKEIIQTNHIIQRDFFVIDNV